ncbi:F-box domain containing protein [Trema orientale]|uniref:F-box domain containing protein n=1 Tax=Trema orientale TaxID=63057 RepID=A0A2P5B5N5_TREOI|nr:F-box domain containing protein [Trema orientale]
MKNLEVEKKDMRMRMRSLCHLELPEEIVMEILLRLPPESLIRFKCVCKSWYTLISDPSFAHKHLHFNENNGVSSSTSLFLRWLHDDDDEDGTQSDPGETHVVRSLITIFDDNDNKDNNDHIPCAIEDLNLSIIAGMPKGVFSSSSHCNGIISLVADSDSLEQIVLYNPTIREFKVLPKTCLDRHALSVGGIVRVLGEGLGYDSKANDYKFIRILHRIRSDEWFAEVYTMSSDSWRGIQIDIKIDSFLSTGEGVCCKGVFYWLLAKPDGILSYDLSTDEFHNVPLPLSDNVNQVDVYWKHRKGCWNRWNAKKKLAVWNGLFALLIPDMVSFTIEMWVMDDFHGGVKPSWTKHLEIGPFVIFYSPIMFWNSYELLMETEDGGIVSYNLGTQKFRNLPIHGVSQQSCYGDFYMKTLVSVKGGN